MAGLTRISGRRIDGALPMFPAGDMSSVTPYFMNDSAESDYIYIPGFAGGSANSSVRIKINTTTSFSAKLYTVDGAESTSGAWNGGMSIATGSGSADADFLVGCYMDETDQLLYMLFADAGTSPDTWYLSSVNEAGTVTAIGNAQAVTGVESVYYGSTSIGALYRTGGDGSGDFAISFTGNSGGNGAASTPYRGTTMTIGASDGAISYSSGLLPASYGSKNQLRRPFLGPTANGIIGGGYVQNAYSSDADVGHYGSLANTVTGRFHNNIHYGSPAQNGYPWGNSSLICFRARSKYVFGVYGSSGRGVPNVYAEEDVHAWLDKLAVYNGIL